MEKVRLEHIRGDIRVFWVGLVRRVYFDFDFRAFQNEVEKGLF